MDRKIDEFFAFKKGQTIELSGVGYEIISTPLRRASKPNRLLASYYARRVTQPGQMPSRGDSTFIKTSTFLVHQPIESSLEAIETNHYRFRKIKRLAKQFDDVGVAAPSVIDVATFDPTPFIEAAGLPPRSLPELDYLVSELVGHIDLRAFVCAREEEVSSQLDFVREFLAEEGEIQAFFGSPESGRSYAAIIRNRWWREPDAGEFKGLSPDRWYQLARALTRNIKRLHNHGLIHGQLSVDSVRLYLKVSKSGEQVLEPTLVDFEESQRLTASLERGGRLENAEETHDIEGLGEILLYLACGQEWAQVKEQISGGERPGHCQQLSKTDTQRYVMQAIFGERSDAVSDHGVHANLRGVAKIVDKCLRTSREDQYLCCEDLASAIEIFAGACERSEAGGSLASEPIELLLDGQYEDRASEVARWKDEIGGALEEIKGLGDRILSASIRDDRPAEGDEAPHSFAHGIWLSKLRELRSTLESLSRRHYEVHGDREELIDHLTRSIVGLQQGDVYLTLTRPSYWSQQNLGSYGRFLSMNQMLAVLRNVHTIRVFVVNRKDKDLPDVQRVIRYHADFVGELERHSSKFIFTRGELQALASRVQDDDELVRNYGSVMLGKVLASLVRHGDHDRRTVYYTGVNVVDHEGVDEPGSKHVAMVLSAKSKTCVTIAFHDHAHPLLPADEENFGEVGGSRRIHKVRFTISPWLPDGTALEAEHARDFLRALDVQMSRMQDVTDFLGAGRAPAADAPQETSVAKLFRAEVVRR